MRQQDLFVPHKAFPDFDTKDFKPEDMKQAMKDFANETRTNLLAIQRYVNQQPQSARGRGPNTNTATPGPSFVVKLPLDTVDYDITGNMIDLTNDRIILPEDGIYLATGRVKFDVGGLIAGPGSIYAYIYANGLFSANRQYEMWYDSAVGNNADINFASQYRGSVRDYLEIWVDDSSHNGAFGQVETAQIIEFTVTMIGRTPSTVQ